MPETLFRQPKSTKFNQGRNRFLINSPEQLPELMKKKVTYEINELQHHHNHKAKFAFRLPQELHFIPLFEQVLFNELVSYHNTHATKERFVHPDTFMLLDKDFCKYIPRKTGARLPMETYFEHEAKHWFEIEADNQYKKGSNLVLFELYWITVPDTKIKALICQATNLSSVHYKSRIMETLMGPNYPSGPDFNDLELVSVKMDKYH